MKGLSPLISTILIEGIYISLLFLALSWGLPIAQKNADIPALNKAEDFLYLLNNKVVEVIRHSSEEEIVFDLPGTISIDANSNQIYYTIVTQGTIYSPNLFICYSKNCNLTQGTLGKDSFSVLGLNSTKVGKRATTTYYLIFRNLTFGNSNYAIDLITPGNATLIGSENSRLIIKNRGRLVEEGNIRILIYADLE